MIPVFGVPTVTRPDVLNEMIASIDAEIGKIVVVDNSGDGSAVAGVDWRGCPVTVISPGRNIGVAASWNLIIKSQPFAKWWGLFNFDLVFAAGELDRLAETMIDYEGYALLPNFSALGVSRAAIAKAGWFDENFIPAYCEDNDWAYRCTLMGVEGIGIPSGTIHHGSTVIRSDQHYREENERTYPQNVHYYVQKWGGVMGYETLTTPFDLGGSPADWRLDPNRLLAQSWTDR